MVLQVFDDAYAGSRVNFDFQGCHLSSDIAILLEYGNPEKKISFFHILTIKCSFELPFSLICLRNQTFYFQC